MPDETNEVTTEAQNGIRWAALQRAIRALREQCAASEIQPGEGADASWGMQLGVLISRNDAVALVHHFDALPEAPNA